MNKKKKLIIRIDKEKTTLPNWDLSIAFYTGLDDPQIKEDKESLKRLSKELSYYRGYIYFLEPYQLAIVLNKYEAMIELSLKLSHYAHLYSDTHKTSEEASNFKAYITEKLATYFDDVGFIHFELNHLSEYKMSEFINHPKLARYVPWLKRIFNAYWTLDEAAAFIIDKKSIVSSAWSRLYDETCAKMRFKLNGKWLNEAEIRAAAGSSDDNVRKAAQREMNRVYKANAQVITMCYNMILQDKRTDDELWGLEEPVEESLSHNHIYKVDLLAMSGEVVDSYIPISQRFFKLMAKMRHAEVTYDARDVNPLDAGQDKKVTWPECVQKVLQAYGDFSIEYATMGLNILNQGIVDAPPAKGKSSGAYCLHGEHPYILLNFTGSEDDVTTLAHELGHGIHHVLCSEIGVLNDSTPTALAEVASEFAENLLFQQQLSEAETDREKLRLLIDRTGRMISSIHRQVAFFKFEERAHRARKKGELSTKQLCQIWTEEISRYVGAPCDKDAEYLWMGISHLFQTPYYVYSYAFAGLVVNNLIRAYEKWEEEGELERREAFEDLYLDMLGNTGVEDFVSLLEPFDIDAEDPDFWANGLKLITKYIDEIERLAKKEKLI
ncbi:MAG: hypothetical protein J6X42_01810 [Alphaproteobacteria bacterium]|nr:hypothetical protein [Alphaproteobacteria bacterium]